MTGQVTIAGVDKNGNPINILSGSDGSSNVAPAHVNYTINGVPNGVSGTPFIVEHDTHTPAAGTATIITTGGTAVIAITGPVKGGYVTNPEIAADQGISTAEPLYVDPVNPPGSTAGSGSGTAQTLDPGQNWVLPCAIPAGVTVRVNAATTGHKFTVVIWS